MVSLTPEMAGNSMVIMLVGYVIALVFQLYMLYLNWKQSKVRDTQQRQIEILEEIRDSLALLKR